LIPSQSIVSEYEGCSILCHEAAVIGGCCVIRTRGLLRHKAPALNHELIMILRPRQLQHRDSKRRGSDSLKSTNRKNRHQVERRDWNISHKQPRRCSRQGAYTVCKVCGTEPSNWKGAESSTYRTESEPSLRLARSTRGSEWNCEILSRSSTNVISQVLHT
jgi:hypothetical protein